MNIEPGIYYDISNEDYHAAEGISSSQVKGAVKRSLLHMKLGKGHTMAQATADQGSAVHAGVLEPEKNLVDCIDVAARRGAAWTEPSARSREQGHIPLPAADYLRYQYSCKALLDDEYIGPILKDVRRVTEASIFARHPRTGILLKARPDLYIQERSLMVDVKTTTNAVPKDWTRAFYDFQYDLQAYYYQMVGRIAGVNCNNFAFAVVEKDAPYATHLFRVTPEVLARAETIVERCLDEMLADWNNPKPKTGWPAFTDIYLPNWLKSKNIGET